MGQDKALLLYEGEPLAAHLARIVSQITQSTYLIGNPSYYSHLGYPVIPDAVTNCGPAGGIYTALLQNEAEWNVIVACDMPCITAELLRTLAQQTTQSDTDCIVPIGPYGAPEPLCGIYHVRCRPVIERAIAEKRLRMRNLVHELRPLLVPGIQPGCFANANSPADWSRIQESAE